MPRQAHNSSNWGGKRKNQTGKPKETKHYSQDFKDRLDAALRRRAQAMGYDDPLEALADVAMNLDKHPSHVIASAWKIIADVMTVKESKHTIEKHQGPQIYLPEEDKDGQEKEVGQEGKRREEGAETGGKVLRH